MVRACLLGGIDPNKIHPIGVSIIFNAASNDREELVKVLIQHDLDNVNRLDYHGNTSLILAAEENGFQ